MARDNRGDRGAMLVFASLLVVFSLAVIGVSPAVAYYIDTDDDGLADFYEIKHALHGGVTEEGPDWDGDGLSDIVEDANGNGIVDVGETDPYNYDTDGDGISDGIEGLEDSPEDADDLINALDWDSDGDFIPDTVEEQIQPGDTERDGVWAGVGSNETNWLVADTDGDGLIDGWEHMWGSDPQLANTDGDGWNDYEEAILYGTDPTDDDTDNDGRLDGIGNEDWQDDDGDGMINAVDYDSDNDGLDDSDEDANENGIVDVNETNPRLYDTDADGFSDGYEIYEAISDPLDGGVDTDGDGWVDGLEIVIWKTNPLMPNGPDTDQDGIGDEVENPLATPGVDSDGDGLIDALDLDSDNDGIDDAEEIVAGVDGYITDPTDVDTDGDGLPDNAEVMIFGTDPTSASSPSDGDPIDPGDEIYIYQTNFDMADTDEDGVDEGLSAGTDRANTNTDQSYAKPFGDSSINALDIDSDGDGLLDGVEFVGATDMVNRDTDGDGLLDGEEVHIWGTNPVDSDSDDDGLSDGAEVNTHGTDPLDNDTDGDGVEDGTEVNSWGSNPLDPDTDGDGILDGETITGTYIDASGVTVNWSYIEDDQDMELGADGIPNVLDTDSDWRESETPANVAYFHDRTEIAYENFVAVVLHARGDRFVIGPLNPGNIDTDGDGLSDVDEVACHSDPLDARITVAYSWTAIHSDGDGLWDLEERVLEGTPAPTMHQVNDFDGDGLFDGDELHPSWFDADGNGVTWPPTSPMLAHSEQDYGYPAPFHDSLNDGEEVVPGADGFVTNPHYPDTDGDGIWDDDDNTFFGFAGYDPTNFDIDGDGLYDGYEDADHDGVVDATETDPLDGDTEDDGIYDGDEEIFGTDPLDWDTDGDTIMDGWEVGYTAANIGADTAPGPFGAGDADPTTKTDPRIVDSDFDGFDDNVEDLNGNGMLDPGETDPQDRDTDGDHLPDYYEVVGNDPAVPPADYYAVGWVDNTLYPTDPTLTDDDGDALEDDLEFEQQTIPIAGPDTDGDGLLDGTEYYGLLGGVTDPSNPDTDNDGCWETELFFSLIEAVDVDTDGDGIFNALDVDSDNDWIWDGAGTEDCAGMNDSDFDGIPDILDNDSDNDMLSDRQEMGLDTWHFPSDNDQDHDNDGRYDGEEYFQEIHQPHQGEWALGWRPSDPNLFDTDLDGMHDGFEVGAMGPIPPAPPWGPGTDPDPMWWDFDGLPNSEPYLYDSDFDGLSDLDEDLNGDGNNADVGATEPDPMDDDTDNEGLIDGYETITIVTDVLLCDTDIDDLADGLETGLLSAMGSDTSPANPCLSQRYDIVEDGAYTTDPLNWDTDNDGLLDGGPGEEDVDRDGFRDGNDPHDTSSDWGSGGESDPNEWDTDRGGVNDMLDVDPVLYTLGDWDIDIHPNAVGVMFDTLDIDAAGAGIPPGSNDTEAFQVWHTDLINNPDPGDGPSFPGTVIDTVYFRSTSLHWAGPLWSWPPANYSVPDTGKLDWFHYTAVSFNPPQVENFAVGASQDVDVTVDVPEGAMPGWYFGYLQAETRRPGTNPGFLDPMPQELPDDYTMLRLYVAPQKDIDICDDDDDPIGVGFMSDPHEFPNPPMDGEMHLVGAPMYPGEITGMFRYANPNTNPDGVWPWPGGSPDGINDYNGLPAYPWVNRTWDTDLPDPQGNVNLTYEIEAQYEWLVIGPIDPTTSISFPSPLMPDLELAQVESSLVFIDTTLLPRGLYVGTVRVFEDVHGILIGDPPDGVWQLDETNDTFELQFQLLLPDIDIDDDYANMTGNQLIIDVLPGDVDVMIGEIEIWNASAVFPPSNVDAVDGPGDEDILDLQYYDPTSGDLFYIPQDGSVPVVTVALVDPSAVQTIDVTIDGLMGDGLDQGQAKRLRLQIPAVPADMPAGTYRTDHPGTWIPGDGTIQICARGMATGIGDVTILQPDGDPNDGSELGMGQGIIYDESISAVAELMDYFHLTVNVIPVVNVEWDDAAWSVVGDPGGILCDDATVNNTGNVEVTDVHFEASALIDLTTGAFIPAMFVGFDPASLSIPYGGSEDVSICVAVAADKRAGVYEGTASLLADGETLFDELPMSVTVNHIPGIDVLDNGYNVVGNVMTLEPGWTETAASGQFEAVNLGNGDLINVLAGITGLPFGVTGNVVILDPAIPWSESRVYAVTVSWIDGTVHADTYPCVVTISADGRTVEDSFQLDVIIGELLAVEFDEDSAEGEGFAGETIDVEVTVENIGNAAISEGIVFTIEDLVGETDSFIPSGAVTFVPVTAPIAYAGSADFTLQIAAPDYLLGQVYEGVMSVYLDGTWMDDIDITVTLEMEDGEVVVFPNPYKASEHDGGITIKVGGVDNAKVSIFDMYGSKVTELTSGSGRDTDVVWNLKNDKDRTVASGMYIVTIDIGGEVVTRKIMVIR